MIFPNSFIFNVDNTHIFMTCNIRSEKRITEACSES